MKIKGEWHDSGAGKFAFVVTLHRDDGVTLDRKIFHQSGVGLITPRNYYRNERGALDYCSELWGVKWDVDGDF